MKGFISLVLALCAVCALALMGKLHRQQASSQIWHMPVAYSSSNYQTVAAVEFADAVKSCTKDQIHIKVHSGGSLFKGHEIKRAVQLGSAPIGERLLSSHVNENALYATDSLPFLATSFEAAAELWTASKEPLSRVLEEEGLHLLYSVPWPPQGMYFKKEIDTPADLNGVKFRTYNVTTAKLASEANMIAVQIEAAELSQALAVGVVESVMASGSTGYDRKLWEHLDYFYDLQAWLPRNYVFANLSQYKSLSPSAKKCFEEAALETEVQATKKAEELSKWYLSQLTENGIEIRTASPELTAFFNKIGDDEKRRWVDESSPYGEQVLTAYGQK